MNEQEKVIDAEDGSYLFIALSWVIAFWIVVGLAAWGAYLWLNP